MIDEIRDVGLGSLYSFFAAIWSLGAMYLENYLNASVGEVLFVGCMVSWFILTVYIVLNPVARQELYRFYLLFGQMFQSGTNNDNNNTIINNNNVITSTMINARVQVATIIIRAVLSNVSVTLMLLAVSVAGSVANLNAIYRILQLLFAIFMSIMFIKDKNKRNVSIFTLLVIVPLAVIGILLVMQPSVIFNVIFDLVGYDSSTDSGSDGLSWIGVILLVICSIYCNLYNITVRTQSTPNEWYIECLFVAFCGMLVGLFVILIDYYFNSNNDNNNNSLLIFFSENQRRTSGESTMIIIISNLILIGWGFVHLIYIFLMSFLYQVGNFMIVTIIATTARILITYFLERMLFSIVLNIWSYCGMGVVVIVSLLYNGEIMYKIHKKRKLRQNYSMTGESETMYTGEEEEEDDEESFMTKGGNISGETFSLLKTKIDESYSDNEMLPMFVHDISDTKSNLSGIQISQ